MAGFDMKNLIHELQRRRMLTTAVIYLVGAWLAIQISKWVLPVLEIPASASHYVWLGAVLLFPLVMIFTWHYDITRSGIRRNAPRENPNDFQLFAADYWLIGTLSVAALAVLGVMLAYIAQH